MKIFKNICMVLAAIFFSSCAIHVGTITGDASISTNNFKMIGMAEGTATTTKIFGIGGLKKNSLVNDAKKDLLQNNPLKEGQALANVTLDFKNSYILFVNKQKATVSADVVEFIAQTPPKPNTKIPENNKPVEKKAVDNKPIDIKPIDNKSVDNKSDKKKPVDSEPEKVSNMAQPIENIPSKEIIKSEKAIPPKTQDNPTPPATPSFEPTISYSGPTEIVTSSGERYKVEAGDYFLGTLDQNGRPENGKLYGKNGRPKHIILPKSNR
jgi:hypothetical protein